MSNPQISESPFDKSIYSRCETDTCSNITQHKSGYCSKCRVRTCSTCREEFISKGYADVHYLCGHCKSKLRKI